MTRQIPHGVIYTNGINKLTSEITHRLQISLWGVPKQSEKLRGADVVAKQIKNYRDDPRAIFVFTVTGDNLETIPGWGQFNTNPSPRLDAAVGLGRNHLVRGAPASSDWKVHRPHVHTSCLRRASSGSKRSSLTVPTTGVDEGRSSTVNNSQIEPCLPLPLRPNRINSRRTRSAGGRGKE